MLDSLDFSDLPELEDGAVVLIEEAVDEGGEEKNKSPADDVGVSVSNLSPASFSSHHPLVSPHFGDRENLEELETVDTSAPPGAVTPGPKPQPPRKCDPATGFMPPPDPKATSPQSKAYKAAYDLQQKSLAEEQARRAVVADYLQARDALKNYPKGSDPGAHKTAKAEWDKAMREICGRAKPLISKRQKKHNGREKRIGKKSKGKSRKRNSVSPPNYLFFFYFLTCLVGFNIFARACFGSAVRTNTL